MTAARSGLAIVVAGLFAACGAMEDSMDEAERAGAEPAAVDGSEAGAPSSDDRGTLTVSGAVIERPGSHEVEIGCQYSRSPGILVATAYGSSASPGTLSLNVGAPAGGVPFDDGTYPGRFSFDEPRSDGRVLTHYGEAQTTIEVVAADRGGIQIRADGAAEDGAVIELTGRCTALGAG